MRQKIRKGNGVILKRNQSANATITFVVTLLIALVIVGSVHYLSQSPFGIQLSGNTPPASSSFGTAKLPAVISIKLTNSQPSATGPNFQQMISFNPAAYLLYESSDLGNIRFYQGSQELYSWCESGCSSSYTGATFWVKVPNIAANSNITINMTLLPLGTEYEGVFAGEAGSQYDNGAKVFTYYNVNPISTSGWTASGSAGLTTSAPSGSKYGTTDALYASGSGGNPNYAFYNAGLTGSFILSFDMYVNGSAPLGDIFFASSSSGSGQAARIDGRGGANYDGIVQASSWSGWSSISSTQGLDSMPNTWYKADVVVNGTSASYYVGPSSNPISTLGSLASTYPMAQSGGYIGLQGDGGSGTTYLNGLVARAYPPSGVMPTVSLGVLTPMTAIPVQLNKTVLLSEICGTSHGCIPGPASYSLRANWKGGIPPYSLSWYSGSGTSTSCPLGTVFYSQSGATTNSSSEPIAPTVGNTSYCLKVVDTTGNAGYSSVVSIVISTTTSTTTIPVTTTISGPYNPTLTTNTPTAYTSAPSIHLYATWSDNSPSAAPYQLTWEESSSPSCTGYTIMSVTGVNSSTFYQTYNMLTLPFTGTQAYFCYTVSDHSNHGISSPVISVNLITVQPISVQLNKTTLLSEICGTSHGCIPGPASYSLRANWTGGLAPYSLFWYSGSGTACPIGSIFNSQNGTTSAIASESINPQPGSTSYCLKVVDSKGSTAYSPVVPITVTTTSTTTSTTSTSTTTTTAPPTKVTETGLPAGATFNVVYNSKPTVMTVTPSNTAISLSTATSGNYAYTIPVSTYGGVGYIPTPKSGYVTTGSSISTTFAANQLLSLPAGGFLPQPQVLSSLNSYLSPNITASGDAIGNFSVIGIYDTGSIEAVVLDCNTDPISNYPCLLEFDFNGAGQLVGVTTSN